jgi:hypothetical protein
VGLQRKVILNLHPFKIESATSPYWLNEQRSGIGLIVKFSEFAEEIPFCATPDDPEEHGRSLFELAVQGEFGIVAEPPPSQYHQLMDGSWVLDESLAAEATLMEAQNDYNQRMCEALGQIEVLKPAVEGGYADDVDIALLPLWQRYHYQLIKVPSQPSWPTAPVWPDKPKLAE